MPIGSPSARALVREVESKIDFTVIPGISAIESKLDQWNLPAVDDMLSAIESKIDLTVIPGISAIESKLDQWDLAAIDEMLSAIESKLDNTIIVDIDDIQDMLSAIESKIDLTVIPDIDDVQTMLSAIESKIDLTVIPGISALESKLDQWDLTDVDDMLSAIESKIDLTLIRDLSAIESKLDGDIAQMVADVTEGKLRAFRRTYAFVSTNEQVANAAEVSLAAPATVTVTFPTGSTLLEAKVVASIKANNQTAAEHNIGVTLQKNIAGGGWVDIRDFTANPPLTLPEVDATGDALTLVEALAITTGQTAQFRWQVDSDNAGAVNYTQVFVLSVEYDFQ